MLISLDLLIDMECLEFGQNLNNSLLESSSYHQGSIVWGGKSLLSNLNPMDWFHSIPNLIVLSRHELTPWGSVFIKQIFKNKDISFLSKIDLI